MIRALRILSFLIFSLTMLGCASTPRQTSDHRKPISEAELTSGSFFSVMEAVRFLRPRWVFHLAGTFVDDRRVSPESLDVETLEGIREIRLLSCGEAVSQFGVRCVSSDYLHILRYDPKWGYRKLPTAPLCQRLWEPRSPPTHPQLPISSRRPSER